MNKSRLSTIYNKRAGDEDPIHIPTSPAPVPPARVCIPHKDNKLPGTMLDTTVATPSVRAPMSRIGRIARLGGLGVAAAGVGYGASRLLTHKQEDQ